MRKTEQLAASDDTPSCVEPKVIPPFSTIRQAKRQKVASIAWKCNFFFVLLYTIPSRGIIAKRIRKG